MASSSSAHQVVGELYAQHHSWVVQLLRRKLGGQEQALDLAQDTFVRILSSGSVRFFVSREPTSRLSPAVYAGSTSVARRWSERMNSR